MSGQLTCPCGQVVKTSDSGPGELQRCPACNAVLEPATTASPPRRGLWSMMQQEPEPTDAAPDDQPTHDAETAADQRTPPPPAGAEPAPPRGLWALMGKSTSEPETQPDPDPSDEDTGSQQTEARDTSGSSESPTRSEISPGPADASPADAEPPVLQTSHHGENARKPAGGKGLWSMMGASVPPPEAEAPPGDATEEDSPESDASTTENVPAEDMPTEPDDEPATFPADLAPPDLPANPQLASRVAARTGLSRRAVGSFLLGLIAVPLAALALLPQAWTKFPATLVGFAALVMGMLALGEVRRSRGRQTGSPWAISGLILGTIAMFLGPLVFTRIGLQWRESTGREQTLAHLSRMGEALQKHHDAFGHYPAGETTHADGDQQVPQHSWMTALLPFLGESTDALYRQIDQQRAYDSARNRPVMATDVPEYLTTTGASRKKTARGLAVTHFAGVGGTILQSDTGLVNAGIFDRGSTVSRGDILDGLSQTLVIGEITHQNVFRPWGEPGNWRVAEKRLNSDLAGFGNFDGSGASFLRADGSVRFFSSATDPQVLQRLMTRDGGDFVREEDR